MKKINIQVCEWQWNEISRKIVEQVSNQIWVQSNFQIWNKNVHLTNARTKIYLQAKEEMK